jgi:hypothetical protein
MLNSGNVVIYPVQAFCHKNILEREYYLIVHRKTFVSRLSKLFAP